ncbi:hypothetical protein [Micromonospora cathayae]|uniref:Uncharacterized protein n=1 Tax=Micromonospora cathayae TaxID=3028804 RepID=A0ABY7ZVR8_9ACTN|nr:hypothetical protein [Micromonospora sp. HUAS 3]WDZ86009.1 hypothetical protein PVK37_06165 [Micromonospora sp. HUAS 3]
MVQIFTRAAGAAGLDRGSWTTQASGDGELALVPLGRGEPRVVDDYVRHIDAELNRVNRYRTDTDRVRLRIAVDQGVAYPGANGYPGRGVVTVSRLLNSGPLRQALAAAPQANLALILSDDVFRALVLGDHTTYVESDFHEVEVVEKEYRATAWIRVPGAGRPQHQPTGAGSTPDQPGEPRPDDPAAGRDPAGTPGAPQPQQRADVMNVFQGAVDASHATFGFSGGSRG